jgi:hypothetical protein
MDGRCRCITLFDHPIVYPKFKIMSTDPSTSSSSSSNQSVWRWMSRDEAVRDMMRSLMQLPSNERAREAMQHMTFTDALLDETFGCMDLDKRYATLQQKHGWPSQVKACEMLVGILQRARGNSWFQKATALRS